MCSEREWIADLEMGRRMKFVGGDVQASHGRDDQMSESLELAVDSLQALGVGRWNAELPKEAGWAYVVFRFRDLLCCGRLPMAQIVLQEWLLDRWQ